MTRQAGGGGSELGARPATGAQGISCRGGSRARTQADAPAVVLLQEVPQGSPHGWGSVSVLLSGDTEEIKYIQNRGLGC